MLNFNIRNFLSIIFFILALDACIAINRWWTEYFFSYLQNVIVMTVCFIIFIALASKSRTQLIGYSALCIALYFLCDFEIGGPSKYFLTPFDPIFNIDPFFPEGSTLLDSYTYRKIMTIFFTLLSAATFATSKVRNIKH